MADHTYVLNINSFDNLTFSVRTSQENNIHKKQYSKSSIKDISHQESSTGSSKHDTDPDDNGDDDVEEDKDKEVVAYLITYRNWESFVEQLEKKHSLQLPRVPPGFLELLKVAYEEGFMKYTQQHGFLSHLPRKTNKPLHLCYDNDVIDTAEKEILAKIDPKKCQAESELPKQMIFRPEYFSRKCIENDGVVTSWTERYIGIMYEHYRNSLVTIRIYNKDNRTEEALLDEVVYGSINESATPGGQKLIGFVVIAEPGYRYAPVFEHFSLLEDEPYHLTLGQVIRIEKERREKGKKLLENHQWPKLLWRLLDKVLKMNERNPHAHLSPDMIHIVFRKGKVCFVLEGINQKAHKKALPYMAPEVLHPKKPYVCGTSDIYSLGQIFKEIALMIDNKPLKKIGKKMLNNSPGRRPDYKDIKSGLKKALQFTFQNSDNDIRLTNDGDDD